MYRSLDNNPKSDYNKVRFRIIFYKWGIYMNAKLIAYNNIIKENDKIYRDLTKQLGLPVCAFWILYVLREAMKTLTQSEICEMLHEPKQTVNSALKKLNLDGYITLSSGNDRRSKCISLTEKGLRFAAETVDLVMTAEQNALSEFTEAELDTFISLFDKYTQTLKQKTKNIGGSK